MPASVFTQENFARLDLVIAQHKGEQGALMPVLYEAKKIFGFISIDIQERISKGLDIPLSEIYGVASFYSTFSDKQKGENIIAVCLGTACYVKGSQKIIDKISKKLNIEVGLCFTVGCVRVFQRDAPASAPYAVGQIRSKWLCRCGLFHFR